MIFQAKEWRFLVFLQTMKSVRKNLLAIEFFMIIILI